MKSTSMPFVNKQPNKVQYSSAYGSLYLIEDRDFNLNDLHSM